MKLYSELQLRASYESGFRLAMETDGGLKESKEEFINSLIPIELPTRDMADEASLNKSELSKIDFLNGWIWTLNYISNQNK